MLYFVRATGTQRKPLGKPSCIRVPIPPGSARIDEFLVNDRESYETRLAMTGAGDRATGRSHEGLRHRCAGWKLAVLAKLLPVAVLSVFLSAPTAGPVLAQADPQPFGAQTGVGWGGSIEVKPASPSPAVTPKRQPSSPKIGMTNRADAQRPRQAATANAVSNFMISGDATRTMVAFDLMAPAEIAARSLSNPSRVIVDLPEVEFRLPAGAGTSGHGLISALRFGLIEAGKSRIVLDTTSAVRIERAEVVLPQAAATFRLEIELAAIPAGELAAAELADAIQALKPSLPAEPQGKPPQVVPQVVPRTGLRPVVVVDAGHGGIDPGATGGRGVEKALVLDVALALRRALVASRRYEVVMTRVNDVFVSLDERLRISRHHQADLFVSLHADSLPGKEIAKGVRGATIYTLSDVASDDDARRLAEKENAVDLLAGLPLTSAGNDQVRSILIDLMRRESLNFSNDFRQSLVSGLRSRVLLARDPVRSGPFKVLRQPGSAAVLIELGYMSNAQDETLMLAPEWQANVATAIAGAIDAHFAHRQPGHNQTARP